MVLGLGRFGASLASELVRRGTEVLGVDSNQRVVQEVADELTHSAVADTTDVEALRQLDVPAYQRAVVGIGTDLEASILTTAVLVDLGIPNIWAKAISRQHDACLDQFLVEPAHVLHHLLEAPGSPWIAWQDARLGVLRRLDHDHDSHLLLL